MSSLLTYRDLLTASGVPAITDALARYDRTTATLAELSRSGDAAHQAPRLARANHHAFVVDAVVEGRPLDDDRLWDAVEDADRALRQAQARMAAAIVADRRADEELTAAVRSSGAELLVFIARRRRSELTEELVRFWQSGITIPMVARCPAVHAHSVRSLWPPVLEPGPRIPEVYRDWHEWAWARLADEDFDVVDGVLAFREEWHPSRGVDQPPYELWTWVPYVTDPTVNGALAALDGDRSTRKERRLAAATYSGPIGGSSL